MRTKVEELRQALGRGGCSEVDPLIPALIRAFATPADHEPEVREVLGMLKSHRCFAALDELTTDLAKRASGSLNIFIRRQLAQAKVDRGRLDEAIEFLTTLSNEVQVHGTRKDRSEVAGLLGRLHKQRFVSATEAGEDGAAELRAAIASYQSVFDLDPSWHGANLIALSARAERAGIDIDSGTAEFWANLLLRDLDDGGRAAWGPWDFAAAGEAWLALHDEERSDECFRKYWSSPDVDGFALGGTARQLREIWQADSRSDSSVSKLLQELEMRMVGRPGGRVEWTPRDLSERAAQAEALFGADRTLQLDKMLKLIAHAGSICRIFDPRNPNAGGTGFLVDGALFGIPEAGSLLLTNHHVLHGPEANDALLAHPDYGGSVPVSRAQTRFTYWGGTKVERTFALKEVRHYSIRNEADFTLATLDGEIPREMALPICVDNKPLRSRNNKDPKQRSSVLVVGHPRGEALTFSLDNTEVVDHELDDQPCTRPRRIHYRTATDHGSSGSPVFELQTLDVIGLHRSGSAGPLRADWPGKSLNDIYEANEAVWIGSVRNMR